MLNNGRNSLQWLLSSVSQCPGRMAYINGCHPCLWTHLMCSTTLPGPRHLHRMRVLRMPGEGTMKAFLASTWPIAMIAVEPLPNMLSTHALNSHGKHQSRSSGRHRTHTDLAMAGHIGRCRWHSARRMSCCVCRPSYLARTVCPSAHNQ